jgi:hypothetical protein
MERVERCGVHVPALGHSAQFALRVARSSSEAWLSHPPGTLVGLVCRVKTVQKVPLEDNPELRRQGGYALVLYDANQDEEVPCWASPPRSSTPRGRG